jgi:hypothetical protein
MWRGWEDTADTYTTIWEHKGCSLPPPKSQSWLAEEAMRIVMIHFPLVSDVCYVDMFYWKQAKNTLVTLFPQYNQEANEPKWEEIHTAGFDLNTEHHLFKKKKSWKFSSFLTFS